MVEQLADAIDDAFFQRMVIEDCGIEERREQGILRGGCARFVQQAAPDRIDDGDLIILAGLYACDHVSCP